MTEDTPATQTEQAALSASEKPAAQSTEQSTAQQTAKSGSAKLTPARRSYSALLLLCILLIGTAGLAFMYWEQQKAIAVLFERYNSQGQQQADTNARFAEFEEKLNAANRELEQTLTAQATAAREQLATQATQLDAARREISSLRLRVNDASGASNQSWMLTEAESLLRLARQRLLSAHDVRSAISLYLASDDLLRQLNDPAVTSVRETLAIELDSLRAVNIPDVQGIYAQLGSISEQVASLNLVADNTAGALQFTPAASEAAAEGQSWFDQVSATLGQYFVVRRQDNPVVPTLSPEQIYMTRQIIRLHLEEARVALLREEPRLYQAALDAAGSEVETYLQGDNKAQILAALQQLGNMPILATLPPSGATLNALRQLAPSISLDSEGLLQ